MVGSMRLYGHTTANKILEAGGTDHSPIFFIEFDIALAEASDTDTKGGIGVYLGAVGLGSPGASHGETSTHSRIKFTVSVVLPAAKRRQ